MVRDNIEEILVPKKSFLQNDSVDSISLRMAAA